MDEIRTTTAGVKTAPDGHPVKPSAALQALCAVTGAAAGVAALLGVIGTPDPMSFTTLRGGVVDLFGGGGLYRYGGLRHQVVPSLENLSFVACRRRAANRSAHGAV